MAYMFVLGHRRSAALAFSMIHQLSGGAWGVVSRQPLGAATRVLPFVTLLFVPIVLGMPHLYEWAHAGRRRKRRDPSAQAGVPQHAVLPRPRRVLLRRSGTVLAFLLNKWSKEQDETGDPRSPLRMQRLSAGGLLASA